MAYKIRLSFAITLALSLLFAVTNVCAQVDPEKTLLGTWAAPEGKPTLVINSVKATGNDEWVGNATQAGRNIEINISKKGSEIYLEWISAGAYRAPFHVKMTDDNKMEGTIEGFRTAHGLAGTPGHQLPPRKITLEKVKAGEVK